MKKVRSVLLLVVVTLFFAGCGTAVHKAGTSPDAEEDVVAIEQEENTAVLDEEEAVAIDKEEDTAALDEEEVVALEKEEDAAAIDEGDSITDKQAVSAVRNYCYAKNPDLEEIEKEEEYPVSWEVESSDDKEIVVLFRSYTGAQVRYYIDRTSGDTHVTEFVPGITTEEELTDETLNVRAYFTE